ncbi:hypothetical protein KSS87_002319, partial [Heliosperma pusillum]
TLGSIPRCVGSAKHRLHQHKEILYNGDHRHAPPAVNLSSYFEAPKINFLEQIEENTHCDFSYV